MLSESMDPIEKAAEIQEIGTNQWLDNTFLCSVIIIWQTVVQVTYSIYISLQCVFTSCHDHFIWWHLVNCIESGWTLHRERACNFRVIIHKTAQHTTQEYTWLLEQTVREIKLLGSHLLSCHPRVYRGTWGTLHEGKWQIAWQQPALLSPSLIRVHQFCAFANCQGKLTHFEVVTVCLVNQKASIKGYLRKLSLKIDKFLGSNMGSHHPGVCKGTYTWRNCVKNSEITRGGNLLWIIEASSQEDGWFSV